MYLLWLLLYFSKNLLSKLHCSPVGCAHILPYLLYATALNRNHHSFITAAAAGAATILRTPQIFPWQNFTAQLIAVTGKGQGQRKVWKREEYFWFNLPSLPGPSDFWDFFFLNWSPCVGDEEKAYSGCCAAVQLLSVHCLWLIKKDYKCPWFFVLLSYFYDLLSEFSSCLLFSGSLISAPPH